MSAWHLSSRMASFLVAAVTTVLLIGYPLARSPLPSSISGPETSLQTFESPPIPSRENLVELIFQMEDPDPAVRNRSHNQLRQVGHPAMELLGAVGGRHPERARGIHQLMRDIQADHGIPPVRAHGVEIWLRMETGWRQPPAGGIRIINLAIQINNGSEKAATLEFYKPDGFGLTGLKGDTAQFHHDPFYVLSKHQTVVVPAGKSQTLPTCQAHLAWSRNGTALQLTFGDGSKPFWYDDVQPGRYFGRHRFGKVSGGGEKGTYDWETQVEFPVIAIEIK